MIAISVDKLIADQEELNLFIEYSSEGKIEIVDDQLPDYEMYYVMEESGALTVIGSYEEDVLVGFIIMIVTKMPHYSSISATFDSFFIHKDYRDHGRGRDLVKYSESIAVDQGASISMMYAPKDSRLSKAARLFGYKDTNTIYTKEL